MKRKLLAIFAAFALLIPAAAYAADTDRAKSVLITLLADNTSGDISPQDVRDWLESASSYAAIYVHDGATAQTLTTGGTAEKMSGFATDGPENNVDAQAASDQIVLPAYAATYEVSFSIAFNGDGGGGGRTYQFHLNDGAEVAQCAVTRATSSTDTGSSAFMCLYTASGSETLSVYAECDGSACDFTPIHSSLVVNRVDL